ncbi:MAG: AmmeMemoRadiSam system protein B [Desulfobacteraceae bacterium]|nr:AmmeMemoRadiSam system protein B [Desulfobacteraceae bacterium]
MGTKPSRSFILVFLILCTPWFFPFHAGASEEDLKDLRPSILAGTWYPGSRKALGKNVQRLLSTIDPPPLEGTLKALVVPHAGYRYSGHVAAHAYALLQQRQFRRIILLGPSHRTPFKGSSVNLQSGYETPLGIVPVDQEMGRKILNAGTHIRWFKQAHALEHSLEIQLPFLQTVLDNFKIVPILMGQQDLESCINLAHSLVGILKNTQDTLLIASTDLSHFHQYSQAKALDLKFIEQVRRLNPQGLAKDLRAEKCEACGGGPVITIMLAAQALGANRAEILNYANSGDVTGDHSRVVGYLSAALIRSSGTGPHPR